MRQIFTISVFILQNYLFISIIFILVKIFNHQNFRAENKYLNILYEYEYGSIKIMC